MPRKTKEQYFFQNKKVNRQNKNQKYRMTVMRFELAPISTQKRKY